MPAATTAVPQPIRPFKPANHTNPIDNIAAYPDQRAAYNRHIGALLSLDAELLHAFHEAVASGGVVQAPRHPEDWRDRAVPATQGVAQPRSGAVVCVPHGILRSEKSLDAFARSRKTQTACACTSAVDICSICSTQLIQASGKARPARHGKAKHSEMHKLTSALCTRAPLDKVLRSAPVHDELW